MKNRDGFDHISVIGLGYIGLPTAALFASNRVKVIGVDVNQRTVDTVNLGKIHIIEPGLDAVVNNVVRDRYLRATTITEPADAFLIAVPTPFKDGSTGIHHPDLAYIEAACESIATVLKKGDLVILESTSPVGTTEQLSTWLAKARPDLTFPQTHGEASDIRIAYCPERVLPGKVLHELVENDRVIGGMTPKCSAAAVDLYKTFVKGECVITNARTAEMCKLTENSFRDVSIAYANELSIICRTLGIDVWELIKLANRHPRVNILQPGPGVGGHCIAVDPWFIVSAAPEQARLIRMAREVNEAKPKWVLEEFNAAVAAHLQVNSHLTTASVSVACFGLAFKPDIDDLRESPSLRIVNDILMVHTGSIYVVEPNIKNLPANLNNKVALTTQDEAISKADIVIFLVAHSSFRNIERSNLECKIVIDACGIQMLMNNS